MKSSYCFIFLILIACLSKGWAAGCDSLPDFSNYELHEGDFIVDKNQTFPDSGQKNLYVTGKVRIKQGAQYNGNIYATETITVEKNAEVDGTVYSEMDIELKKPGKKDAAVVTGDSCSIVDPQPTPRTVDEDTCNIPPDVSDYIFYEGDFIVPSGTAVSGNYYVTGTLTFAGTSGNSVTTLDGNVYVVGDLFLNKKSEITGSAYVQGVISKDNNGNTIIVGNACDAVPTIPPVELPVDELIGECNDIFQDAAQSYISTGKLSMQKSTHILDSKTNLFPFASISGEYYPPWPQPGGQPHLDSCGTDDNGADIQCGITSPPSTPLSSFTVTPNNNGKSFALWNNEQVSLGGEDEANDLYNRTAFQQITAGSSSVITFLPLDYSQGRMYQIDSLVVQNNSTVKLSAGVYALNSLKLDGSAKIEVVGEGDVYLFVETVTDLYGSISTKNSDNKLFLVLNGNLSIYSSSALTGSIYSTGDVLLGGSFTLYGQVSARNVTLHGSAKIENNSSCGSPPVVDENQFVISTQPNGLICQPHPVTLQVLDSDGELDQQYTGVVDLSVLEPLGDWSMVTDNERLDNKSANDGSASYEFQASDKGQVDLTLAITSVADVSLLMSRGGLASEPAAVSFQSSMIKVEQSCSDPIAGQCINIANRDFSLTLSAVKSDDSLLCESYDPKNIAFWSDYLSPASDIAVKVGQTEETVPPIAKTAIGKTVGSAVSLPISFSAGVATIQANYPDAGKIKINVKDADIEVIDGAIETIVNPYRLMLDDLSITERNKEAGRVKSSGALIRASVPDYNDLQVDTFDITAKAIIDCTSSGESKNCTSLGANVLAPSFASQVTLKPSAVGSYLLGDLNYQHNLQVNLSAGQFNYEDLAYSEAGMLGLQLEAPDYLLAGNKLNIESVKEVGHFYPDYLAFGDYNLIPACNADFTYLGQKSARLSFTLQAYQQAASPALTKNYDSNSGYVVAPTANFSDAAFDQTPLSLTARLLRDDYYNQSAWHEGVYTVTEQPIGIERILNTPDGPYESSNAVDYFIKLDGNDGEKIKRATDDRCSDDMCALGNLGNMVYGRLQAGNGHGSEFQSIRTLVEATYFDGTQFVPFERDECTTLVNEQLSTTPTKNGSNEIAIGTGTTTLSVLNSPLISGKGYLQFTAPDDRGTLDYFIRLKGLADSGIYAPWLLDDGNAVSCPDETGTLTDCISGYVEFGLFRGNDRIIYRLQTFD